MLELGSMEWNIEYTANGGTHAEEEWFCSGSGSSSTGTGGWCCWMDAEKQISEH